MKTTTLLIHEDRPILKLGLEQGLKSLSEDLQCNIVSSVEAAVEYMRKNLIDVFLFSAKHKEDTMMKHALEMKRGRSFTKVAAFVDLNYHQSLETLLSAKIDGYFTREVSLQELERGIRQVDKGLTFHQASVAHELSQKARHVRKSKIMEAKLKKVLTAREREVVQLISQDFSTQEIADKLFLSKRTIEGYRLRIFEKTGCRSPLGIAKLAVRLERGASNKTLL